MNNKMVDLKYVIDGLIDIHLEIEEAREEISNGLGFFTGGYCYIENDTILNSFHSPRRFICELLGVWNSEGADNVIDDYIKDEITYEEFLKAMEEEKEYQRENEQKYHS